MDLKTFAAWAIAHPELALVVMGAAVTAITSAYAAVKIAFQKATGRAAKGGVWTVFDVVVELLPNVPGALNRLLRSGGAASIFAPPASTRETQAPPPPPPSGQSGRASLDVVALLLAVALCLVGLGAVLTACDPIREGVMRITPGVPDPSGCAEGVQRCNGLVPEVCSASHRWWASLPPRADGSPRVCRACVVDDAGVAGCDELAADGGTR